MAGVRVALGRALRLFFSKKKTRALPKVWRCCVRFVFLVDFARARSSLCACEIPGHIQIKTSMWTPSSNVSQNFVLLLFGRVLFVHTPWLRLFGRFAHQRRTLCSNTNASAGPASKSTTGRSGKSKLEMCSACVNIRVHVAAPRHIFLRLLWHLFSK